MIARVLAVAALLLLVGATTTALAEPRMETSELFEAGRDGYKSSAFRAWS